MSRLVGPAACGTRPEPVIFAEEAGRPPTGRAHQPNQSFGERSWPAGRPGTLAQLHTAAACDGSQEPHQHPHQHPQQHPPVQSSMGATLKRGRCCSRRAGSVACSRLLVVMAAARGGQAKSLRCRAAATGVQAARSRKHCIHRGRLAVRSACRSARSDGCLWRLEASAAELAAGYSSTSGLPDLDGCFSEAEPLQRTLRAVNLMERRVFCDCANGQFRHQANTCMLRYRLRGLERRWGHTHGPEPGTA